MLVIRTKGQVLSTEEVWVSGTLYRCPFCSENVYQPSQRHRLLAYLESHRFHHIHLSTGLPYNETHSLQLLPQIVY
ncbi:hypothetical protein AAFF_G00438360 [Aldrovandia affinis]|uniref:Uncharacterized protein n=1 Tax=Aldrovandia affinis TaxID=143900 RepID=A0AAD7WI66_9TELE|nr:hypothetical protein AAFF_G00438360 [Aldrovandia affinis]